MKANISAFENLINKQNNKFSELSVFNEADSIALDYYQNIYELYEVLSDSELEMKNLLQEFHANKKTTRIGDTDVVFSKSTLMLVDLMVQMEKYIEEGVQYQQALKDRIDKVVDSKLSEISVIKSENPEKDISPISKDIIDTRKLLEAINTVNFNEFEVPDIKLIDLRPDTLDDDDDYLSGDEWKLK
jgi:DNA repair protein RadC